MPTYPCARALLLTSVMIAGGSAVAAPLADDLIKAAPDANERALRMALDAARCAVDSGVPRAERLALIDYSKPSTQPRLWVFDLASRTVLYREWVAHGRNSGDNFARTFSNAPGSLESSLGLFRTLQTYEGHNGYSLRLDGLEPGINDHALERAIVMHGADYVNPANALALGRIGRSWGCPAVRPAVAHPLLDALKDGQFVFSYYPDARWMQSSAFLACPAASARHAGMNSPSGQNGT